MQSQRIETEMHSRIDKIPFHLVGRIRRNDVCALCALANADKMFLTKIYGLYSNQLTRGTQPRPNITKPKEKKKKSKN